MIKTTEISKVLVTGRLWLGTDGAGSISEGLLDMLCQAKQEVIIVAYRITGGANELIKAIECVLARGCVVRLVRNKSSKVSISEDKFLDQLTKDYHNLIIWDFKEVFRDSGNNELHAKMVIVDRKVAIVGSANYSRNGMLENHEIALQVSGHVARSLAISVDTLIHNGIKEGVITKRSDEK